MWYHLDPVDVERVSKSQPFFIYQRVQLLTFKNYFTFSIEAGYWYWIREIRSTWSEIDAAGAVFAPDILVEVVESAVARVHQTAPFPLRLISTPNCAGVQINAGGQLTAAPLKNVKMINEVRMYRDNVQLLVSGQNATSFPAFADIVIVGYLIPDSKLPNWKGSNDGAH